VLEPVEPEPAEPEPVELEPVAPAPDMEPDDGDIVAVIWTL